MRCLLDKVTVRYAAQGLVAPYRYARLPLVLRPEQIDQDDK